MFTAQSNQIEKKARLSHFQKKKKKKQDIIVN